MRWLALTVCGCGRLAFDAVVAADGPAGSDGDGPALACVERVPNLTARFPFEGDVASTLGGTPAIALGAPSFGAGRTGGQALLLDGVDDLVQLPANLAVDDYSFSFWVRTTDVGTGDFDGLWFDGKSLIDAEVCGSPLGGDFGTALIDGGHVAASATTVHSTTIINDDAWHHLVFSRDLPAATMTTYVDGVEQISVTFSAAGDTHVSIPWIGIGNNPCRVTSNMFAGRFDEVAFYDRVLTPIEVAMLFGCVDP